MLKTMYRCYQPASTCCFHHVWGICCLWLLLICWPLSVNAYHGPHLQTRAYTYTQCMCPHLGESRSTPCTEACCAFLETWSCSTVVWEFKYVQWASGLCLLSVYAIFPNLLLSALLCNKSWTLKTSLLCQLAPCLASRRMKWRFFFPFMSFCSVFVLVL